MRVADLTPEQQERIAPYLGAACGQERPIVVPRRYLPGVDSPEDDPGPPPCPDCGDESEPELLAERQVMYWPCCGAWEVIDPYDDPSL